MIKNAHADGRKQPARFVLSAIVFALVAAPLYPQTMRPEIVGRYGMVAAGRHYTVEAGTRMLRQGGNAIDAGVAAVFAAAVCEISHFGFGGEAPAIIYDSRLKQVVVINGQGTAPRAARPELFKEKGTIDSNGPLAATVPAVLDAMCLALEKYGTMRLEQVLQPAIELADGFPMYELLRRYLVSERKSCEKWPSTMQTYYPEGRIPEVGEMFKQPNLARTLRAIVKAEKDALARYNDRIRAIRAARDFFYKGQIAREIAEAAQAAGGVLSYEDLASYQGRIEKPVSTTYRGYQVYKCGPWSQGPVLLQALNILEGFDLAEMGHLSTEYIHTVIEAIKLAYDDRDVYYADPDFVQVPIRGLLSKEYASERRKLIDRRRASLEHRPGDPYPYDPEFKGPKINYVPKAEAKPGGQQGDTTSIQVIDKDGNLFSCTPSSGWLIGGAFIAGDTGIPLGNRLQAFRLDPASPNVLQGGKRPRTTLTPTVVLKDGKPFLAIGTPGGDNQDQQILNVLLNIIDFGMSLQEAIEAPRIGSDHMFSSFSGHVDKPGEMEVENRIAPGVVEALKAKGHIVNVRGAYGISAGIVAVGMHPEFGTLRGGADIRRERYVFGW